MNHFSRIPDDIMRCEIIPRFDVESLIALSYVDTRFRKLLRPQVEKIYELTILMHFPKDYGWMRLTPPERMSWVEKYGKLMCILNGPEKTKKLKKIAKTVTVINVVVAASGLLIGGTLLLGPEILSLCKMVGKYFSEAHERWIKNWLEQHPGSTREDAIKAWNDFIDVIRDLIDQ